MNKGFIVLVLVSLILLADGVEPEDKLARSFLQELLTQQQEGEINSGDALGIRAGGEPPLKTGEAPRNTIVASTKMRFKIPNMNA